GDRPQVIQALHGIDGVLDRPGHRDHHLVDRKHAVIRADHDAREIRVRENRHRNGERQVHAYGHQRQNDEDNRLAVAIRPVGRGLSIGGGRWCREIAHLAFGFASSFFSSLPPFSSGSSSSTSFTVVSITLTLALSSTPMPPTTTTSSPGETPPRTWTLFPSR